MEMGPQQTHSNISHEICNKLSEKLIENLGNELIKEVGKLIKRHANVSDEQAREIVNAIIDTEFRGSIKRLFKKCHIIVKQNPHYYNYCKIHSEKLGNMLDPFIVLETIVASTLNLPRCIQDIEKHIQKILTSPISKREKLELVYKISLNAIKKLFEDVELREAVKRGANKLIEYINRSNYRIQFEQDSHSSIIIKNVYSISFYRSSGSIMVFSDIGGGFVEDRVGCPLPSWVKGYLRLLLHKLVFTYALKEAIDSGRADLADLYTLYVYLLSRDDESIVVKVPRCEVNVVNLVGVLMGCGGLASFLKVYRVASEPGCCVYRFGVERERIPYVVALVQRLYGFLEKLGVKVGDVVEMLEYFDDVVAVLASWASTALDDRGYRFLPFTASYPRVHSQLPPQYVFSKTRASEASVRRYLGVLMGLLRSYALYLIDVVGRCRR